MSLIVFRVILRYHKKNFFTSLKYLSLISATKNVIKLCIEENVGRLVHCSSTEVTLQTSWRGGIVAVSIYKPEPKLAIPVHKSQLIFGEYAASKLKAEGIVLKAHGTPLKNGNCYFFLSKSIFFKFYSTLKNNQKFYF